MTPSAGASSGVAMRIWATASFVISWSAEWSLFRNGRRNDTEGHQAANQEQNDCGDIGREIGPYPIGHGLRPLREPIFCRRGTVASGLCELANPCSVRGFCSVMCAPCADRMYIRPCHFSERPGLYTVPFLKERIGCGGEQEYCRHYHRNGRYAGGKSESTKLRQIHTGSVSERKQLEVAKCHE